MSESVPLPGQPSREAEVLEASREASRDEPRLLELLPEEVTHQLVLKASFWKSTPPSWSRR